jgi:hypothetical protein
MSFSDTGSSSTDNITNALSPTFEVTGADATSTVQADEVAGADASSAVQADQRRPHRRLRGEAHRRGQLRLGDAVRRFAAGRRHLRGGR